MSHRIDIRRSRPVLATIVGLFIIPMAQASADDGASQMPPLKITPPQPRSEFYFKVDSGAVFFQPPSKDNSNFQEAVNPGPMDGASSLQSQSGDDVTWSLGGTIGFYLPNQPTDSWMGRNLRVEASGNYFGTYKTQNAGLSVSPGGVFVSVGRLDGNYTGLNTATDIGSVSVSSNPVAGETLTTRDNFYQAGAAFRSDYFFDYGQIVLSPKLGFDYSNLDQNFHTTAAGSRGSIDQHEDLDTNYFGPKFALELKVQVARNFVYFAEGELSPFYATSNYFGTQFGTSTALGGGAGNNAQTDSKDSFSFKAGLKSGFYYDFGPVILKLGGGFEYWNYVATIQESTLSAGANPYTSGPFSIQPSHLGSSDMLNPSAEMSVILPF